MPPRYSVWLLLVLAGAADIAGAADALLKLTAAHFRDTALINDDPVAGVTTVSTEKGYVEHHGPLQAIWNDQYLYAIVDRRGQRRTFKVIATITYRGERRSYRNARFRGTNGTATVPTVYLKTTSVNCPTGECTYTDQLEFPVEEGVLRQTRCSNRSAAAVALHAGGAERRLHGRAVHGGNRRISGQGR